MATRTRKFNTPKTREQLDKVLAFARQNGAITSSQAGAVLGIDPSHASKFIKQLVTLEEMECIEPASSGAAPSPAVYAACSGASDAEPVLADDFPRRVIVRQEYPLHHIRDPFACLLFGVPAAMRVAA